MNSANQPNKSDILFISVCVFGVVAAFMSIYAYAQKGQAASAVWAAGLTLFFFTFLLATKLAHLRQRKG